MNRLQTIVTAHKGLPEHLQVNLTKRIVKARLQAFRFIDKDTKQVVLYAPSLEVSGYGDTPKEAAELFNAMLEGAFSHLLSLTPKQLPPELAKYGWKKAMFNKEFSRVFVDGNGELQGLNAVEESIEKLTLTAA